MICRAMLSLFGGSDGGQHMFAEQTLMENVLTLPSLSFFSEWY